MRDDESQGGRRPASRGPLGGQGRLVIAGRRGAMGKNAGAINDALNQIEGILMLAPMPETEQVFERFSKHMRDTAQVAQQWADNPESVTREQIAQVRRHADQLGEFAATLRGAVEFDGGQAAEREAGLSKVQHKLIDQLAVVVSNAETIAANLDATGKGFGEGPRPGEPRRSR
jgi:hypothetical protein